MSATIHDLSPRQQQVLALLAEGLRDKQIATRLGIAASTTKHHVNGIYRALGIEPFAGSPRVEVVRWYWGQIGGGTDGP